MELLNALKLAFAARYFVPNKLGLIENTLETLELRVNKQNEAKRIGSIVRKLFPFEIYFMFFFRYQEKNINPFGE